MSKGFKVDVRLDKAMIKSVTKQCTKKGVWSALDHLAGREVSILQTDTDAAPVTGLCGGIQSDGSLLVGGTRIYAGEAHVTSVGA